jgi:hypothetical protein
MVGGDNENDGKEGKPSILFSSHTGSRRHLKDCAVKGLHLVSIFQGSDFFLTFTCNINWPEIKAALREGQTAFDCPDYVCEVFHNRLKNIMHNIRNGKYFGGRELDYDIHVIEYQERGLPHAHVVFKLKNTGIDYADPESCAKFVDEHIQAFIPPLPEKTDTLEEKKAHRLHELVTKHMQHKHSYPPKVSKIFIYIHAHLKIYNIQHIFFRVFVGIDIGKCVH